MGAVAVQPIAHQLGVETTLYLADRSFTDVESHFVLHVTAVGKNDYVAGLENNCARCRPLVWERMHVTCAPMIEAARGLGVAILNHCRVFAELYREISTARSRYAH